MSNDNLHTPKNGLSLFCKFEPLINTIREEIEYKYFTILRFKKI